MAMTLVKNPAVKHYFKTDIRKNMKFFIVCLALHMLSFPLTFLSMIFDATLNENSSIVGISEFFTVMSIPFTAVAILMGIIISICDFSYLHKKHESDTYMSLPLSDKQRFLTDYFAGLVTYILPVLISGVFTFITGGIFFYITKNYDCYNFSHYEPYVYGEHTFHWFEIMLIIYILAIIAMVMFYTLTVLACTLCGSIFETIIHTVILNGAIPGMIALLSFIMFNQVPGVIPSDVMLPMLAKTSPIGATVSYFYYANRIDMDVLLFPFLFKFCFWLVAFTVGYVLLAYMLYKKRKAEDVAKPYVFISYYYIIIACITFALCSTIPADTELMILPMIIVSAVVYLAFEVITKRGFKKFGRSAIRCGVTICASIIAVGLLNNPWGFGAGSRVPDADSVKSVSINYFSADEQFYSWDTPMVYEEDDAIKIITSLHEKVAKDRTEKAHFNDFLDEYNYSDYYGATTITYKLKNGTSFTRNYELTKSELYALCEIETCDEYAQNIADAFEESYEYDEDCQNEFYFYSMFENHFISANKPLFENNDEGYSRYVSQKEYEAFVKDMAKAIELDLKDRTLEQVRKPYSYYGSFDIWGRSIYVYGYDENMLGVLAKYGIYNSTPETFLESYKENVLDWMYISNDSVETHDLYIWETSRYFDNTTQSPRVMELVNQLVPVATPYSFDYGDVYCMSLIGQSSLYIPKEYEATAKELYSYGQDYH